MTTKSGELITETLPYDGGRRVSAYVPTATPEAVIFAGDGELISGWGEHLNQAPGVVPTMIIAAHRLSDETARLHEYSPGFDADRFAAHERFFVNDLASWAGAQLGLDLPAARTAIYGVSASAELALALGLRHPDRFGVILGASPGAGYQPPGDLGQTLPRTYLVAGTEEPFFRDNAARWADALRDAGAEVVLTERAGDHGDPFWQEELPLMVRWAFD